MLNKANIQGRLTRDVELRATKNGTSVASFTVAWSEKYKDTEQKLFMPCIAWGKEAEFVSKYFCKGKECVVEGKLTSRQWEDKNGNKRETIELIVDQVHFCGNNAQSGGNQNAGDNQAIGDHMAALGGFTALPGDDNDLPF